MDAILFIAALCAVAVVAVLLARAFYKKPRDWRTEEGELRRPVPAFPRRTLQDQQSEYLDQQLEAVTRAAVTFYARKIMGRGEFEVFRAAMSVTRQSYPSGAYPFYIFPQVSLGQIIGTDAPSQWQADQAHRAINSKRCDFLIADRYGQPIAVLEYQGSGHNLGGTAERRDRVKRIALNKAGVRFVEIRDGTGQDEMQQIIRDLLVQAEKKPA
jgi:Protein of unknown function (DUF2726)